MRITAVAGLIRKSSILSILLGEGKVCIGSCLTKPPEF